MNKNGLRSISVEISEDCHMRLKVEATLKKITLPQLVRAILEKRKPQIKLPDFEEMKE